MYDEQYEAVRRQVVRRFIFRASFFFHLILYLLTMLLIFRISGTLSEDDLMGGFFAAAIWGACVLGHGALAFNWFSRWFGNWFDQATQRELERIRQLEKPKRAHLEMGEDGELVEVEDYWLDENEEQAKHHAG